MPLVSVIMPSYNYASFISIAIESVINQSLNDLELIIVDDNSKDNSKEIINQFKKQDVRVKTIFHEKNEGIAVTMNDGIKESKGKYVAFIDADDIWLKEKLYEQVKILEKNEELIVWSDGEIIDEKGNSTGETFTQIYEALQKKKSGEIFNELLINNFILGSSLIAKKNNLIKFKFNKELKYLNDWLYYVELAKNFEFYYEEKTFVKYRIHGNNTNKDAIGYFLDGIHIIHIFFNKFKLHIPKEIRSRYLFYLATNYYQMGSELLSYLYVLRAIINNPKNQNAKNYLITHLKIDHPFIFLFFNYYFIFKNIFFKNT